VYARVCLCEWVLARARMVVCVVVCGGGRERGRERIIWKEAGKGGEKDRAHESLCRF
jgi:hypothetical protein